jgi:amino acid permease
VVSVVVALMNVSLALLFSIVGSICVSSLNFTLPGTFYVLLFKHEGWTKTRFTAPLLIVLGLGVMLTNFVLWGMGRSA